MILPNGGSLDVIVEAFLGTRVGGMSHTDSVEWWYLGERLINNTPYFIYQESYQQKSPLRDLSVFDN